MIKDGDPRTFFMNTNAWAGRRPCVRCLGKKTWEGSIVNDTPINELYKKPPRDDLQGVMRITCQLLNDIPFKQHEGALKGAFLYQCYTCEREEYKSA